MLIDDILLGKIKEKEFVSSVVVYDLRYGNLNQLEHITHE